MSSSGSSDQVVRGRVWLHARRRFGWHGKTSPVTRGTAERIDRAASSLLRDRSFADITTREVAREAGIAEATLFRHISTKADLFLRVYGDQLDSVSDEYERVDLERAEARPSASDDHLGRILGMYERRVQFYQQNFANAVQYLLAAFDPSSPRRPRTIAQGERIIRYVEGILDDAAAGGHLAPAGVPRLIAENVHAVELHEIVRAPLRNYPPEQMWRRLRLRLEQVLSPVLVDPRDR